MPKDQCDRNGMDGGQRKRYAERTDELSDPDVSPQSLIQPEQPQDQNRKNAVEQDKAAECIQIFLLDMREKEIKPHPQRQKIGAADSYEIVCAEKYGKKQLLLSLFPARLLFDRLLVHLQCSIHADSAVGMLHLSLSIPFNGNPRIPR